MDDEHLTINIRARKRIALYGLAQDGVAQEKRRTKESPDV